MEVSFVSLLTRISIWLWDEEDTPPPTMTCVMCRALLTLPPSVISSWELKLHVQWGGPILPYPPYLLLPPRSAPVAASPRLAPKASVPITMTLPYPPLVISSWELKLHVQWGGPTLPLISHQQLRVEVTWAMRRIHPTLPYPPLVISSWELKWHVQWGGPTLPLISHQQLRVEVTCAMRRTNPALQQLSAVESWNDMSNEEDPPFPSPPPVISSWQLKWHVQWGGPTLPPSVISRWEVEMTWAMKRTHPTLAPHQSSAVASWSDMCNGRTHPTLPPISHQQLRVEVTWAMKRTHPTLPPIGHQQLRVEVTCAMKRTHPTYPPISHQQLRVEVARAIRRTHPTPHWLSAVGELKVSCTMSRTHPTLPPTMVTILHCQHTETPGVQLVHSVLGN